MKRVVWISKHALTDGLFSLEGKIQGSRLEVIRKGKIVHYLGSEWHLSRTVAALRAEGKRDDKISALRLEIKRLKQLDFRGEPAVDNSDRAQRKARKRANASATRAN